MANDIKIQDIALGYIRKHVVGGCSKWPSTTLGVLHSIFVNRPLLDDGELVLVSAFFSTESWYAFTTRRIVSQFLGVFQSLDPSNGIRADFGNFKGYVPGSVGGQAGVLARESATVTTSDSQKVIRFEFETWEASMLPIYAARYWAVKHPALDKFMKTAEREDHRTRNR